jgi:hypothetical protein
VRRERWASTNEGRGMTGEASCVSPLSYLRLPSLRRERTKRGRVLPSLRSALPPLRSTPPSLRPVLPSPIRDSPLFVRFRRREGRTRPREGRSRRREGNRRPPAVYRPPVPAIPGQDRTLKRSDARSSSIWGGLPGISSSRDGPSCWHAPSRTPRRDAVFCRRSEGSDCLAVVR